MNNILVIDDDQELCALLQEFLSLEGLQAVTVNTPLEGIEMALSGQHDLVVLDVMLPQLSGFEALRRIRATSQVPVLMLTACGGDVDRIMGLEGGADDYLQKPFNPRELLARIRAILRRAQAVPADEDGKAERIAIDDLELVPGSRTIVKGDTELSLTAVEFSILEILLRQVGRVVSREDLTRKALGRELSGEDRSIDVHLSNLRRKLGQRQDGSERIKTIRGMGYLYAA